MAASALEVRPHNRANAGGQQLMSGAFKRCAIWTPLAVWFAYSLASVLVSLNIGPGDPCLSPPTWSNSTNESADCANDLFGIPENHDGRDTTAASVFVVIVKDLGHMRHFVNASIAYSAFTCASTNLYVASRALYGLTHEIVGGPVQSNWLLRFAAWFGVTNKNRVPVRAMGASALAFLWVPICKAFGNQSAKSVSENGRRSRSSQATYILTTRSSRCDS